MPGTRRLRPAVLALATMAALLLAAACTPSDLLEAELRGQLLDPDGAPVAGAVVFVPGAGAASAGSTIAIAQAGTCQAPTEDYQAKACTDAEGRFALRVTAPLLGKLTVVFERLYWRATAEIDLGVRVPGQPVEVDPVRFPPFEGGGEELEAAVRFALPSLARFELVTLNTEKAIAALGEHAATPGAGQTPIDLPLPILQPDDRSVDWIDWTAYHVDVRAVGIEDCAIGPDTFEVFGCEAVDGPSLTFQGLPDMDEKQLLSMWENPEGTLEALQNEAAYQLSVLSVIGDELEGTYYGAQLAAPHTPSSLQGLRSVLDVHYDEATVNRLLADGGGANYLLHNQADLRPFQQDGELHVDALGAGAANASPTELRPASHFLEDGVKYLNVVMVADSTVYDAVEGRRLVPNYFARLDAMANRQDVWFRFVQMSGTAAPASLTTLNPSNAFSVRTRIAGYRRLTESGQEKLVFPADDCGDEGSLIDNYRALSWNKHTYDNEYWMWWTNTDAYPGSWGCAYIGALHQTPRGNAVGWTSFRNYTLETVGQTFMHETGHLLNAVHSASVTSQRCRVLGIFPVGVTGPSIMGGTSNRNLRTNCFAVTQPTATSLRNLARIALYLHARLD